MIKDAVPSLGSQEDVSKKKSYFLEGVGVGAQKCKSTSYQA